MDNGVQKHLRIKKILSVVSTICFVIFVIIQTLALFLWALDYSFDGTKGGFVDVLLYLGMYLLISHIYLIPQSLIIINIKKLLKVNHVKPTNNLSALIDKRSKALLIMWTVIMVIHGWIIFIFAM
ncbi:MAG: hypothetical protein ACI4IK_07830 [Eubacterium sp.]